MDIPSTRPRRHARLEIVPLIDIMFFLLATFVMVSLSMVKNRGIPVLLPETQAGAPLEHRDHVVISITDSGQLYLDKSELDLAGLVQALSRFKQTDPELRVFINGDQNARLGLAIAVLDETRKLGITKVAFETSPPRGR
jgi:biopolymer transport protein ExbD